MAKTGKYAGKLGTSEAAEALKLEAEIAKLNEKETRRQEKVRKY